MPETPQTFFLTTPIYYVNARPHIGHAYTTIVADVLARRARAQGIDTYFLTGTDEHGQKIERSAAAAGIPPQQFADEVSATFSTLWQRMGITHDDFIRTTSPRHKRGVQKLFQTLQENGKIELRSYTGSYCVSDEAFVDLPAGTPCPDCGRPLETVTEQNYFFKLSEYQLPLINLIESNQLAIQPESRRNEVLSFLRGPVSDLQRNSVILSEAQSAQSQHSPEAEKNSVILSEAQSAQPQHSPESEKKPVILSEARSAQSKDPDEAASASSGGPFPTQTLAYSALGTPYIPGTLKDLSISRTSFEWGIPVPGDEEHVIYVWLDALANYMTALGYGSEDDTLFQKFWPADLHIVGKEIIRFHCVYWPAFLLAAGLELPKQVVAHGWLLFEESKMSKSRGNIVRTETILDAFGPLCPEPNHLNFLSFRSRAEKSAVAPSPAPTAPQAPVILSEGSPSNTPLTTAPVILSEDARTKAPFTTEPVILSEGSRGSLREPQSKDPEEPAPATSAGAFPTQSPQPEDSEQALLKHHQDLFAADILRYFLLREIPFGQDGSFSFDALITRYNADLANGYGNLVSRTLNLISQSCGGSIPTPRPFEKRSFVMEDANAPSFFAGIPNVHTVEGPLLAEQAAALHIVYERAFKELLFTSQVSETTGQVTKGGVVNTVLNLVAATDGLITQKAPWKLAKSSDADSQSDLHDTLYTAAESIRIITLLLHPILPYATAKVWAQLGLDPAQLTSNIKHLASWGLLKPGTKLGPLSPLFPRADKGLAQIMSDLENPKNQEPIACVTGPNDPPSARLSAITAQHDATHPATDDLPTTPIASEQSVPSVSSVLSLSTATDSEPQITIDDFAKVELRVAQIIVAERIPKADKLLRLEVDLGYEKRQILSGIAEWYTPEELIGRRIVVITNLAPRKMRGLESHGMLLAASTEGGKPHLATFTDAETLPLGSRLK
jgi:methionyl-tRNA synthetase